MQSNTNRLSYARGIAHIAYRLGCIDFAMDRAIQNDDQERWNELNKLRLELIHDRRMLNNCMK